MPRNYIDGLIMANNIGDADHGINISVGSCRGEADDSDIIFLSTFSKYINGPWAEGDGQTGLDIGSVAANTWYHVWVIKRTDNGTVEVLFSLDPNNPGLPSDYDCKRRIGSVLTNSSANIIAFVQRGDWFTWLVRVVDANAIAGPSNATLTLSVPPGATVQARIRISINSATVGDEYTVKEIAMTTGAQLGVIAQVATTNNWAGEGLVWTNTSSQISHNATDTDVTCTLHTNGWVDPRGKNE